MTDAQRTIINFVTSDIVSYQVEDEGLTVEEAMDRFYASAVFEKLLDIETGLYLASSAYTYELFLGELRQGRIVQEEQ